MKPVDVVKLVFMALYATGVTAASFFFFYCLVFNKIPEDNQQYANLILGFLIGSPISTFLGYYFGMSQSTSRSGGEKVPPPTEYTQTTTETTTASKSAEPKEG